MTIDHREIFQERLIRLRTLRADPEYAIKVAKLRAYYSTHIIDFINDWGTTADPRNLDVGLPLVMPFILFPRQEDFIRWIIERWQQREGGAMVKTRDVGASWCAISFSASACLLMDGIHIGFGSRKQEYVDDSVDPKSIFWKGRMFINNLPPEFRLGWNEKDHSRMMSLDFPMTNSHIGGEAGHSIGRGNRCAIYFVDEAAHLEHPDDTNMALSQTTNCQIDMSSVNGADNPFWKKVETFEPRRVFHFKRTDDPRKTDEWYEKEKKRIGDPVIIAQEIDCDPYASKENIIIPNVWVKAAIDAHIKLGIQITGTKRGAFDVADLGKDLNCFGQRTGILLDYLESWSGKGTGDIFQSTSKVFDICDRLGLDSFDFDSDGLGAGVRGDANVLNDKREAHLQIEADPFRGSGAVIDPQQELFERAVGQKSRTNEDYFKNRKAQEWYRLAQRFYLTYRAVVEGASFDPSEIIAIDSKLPELGRLETELSRPQRKFDGAGKMLIDKAPEGQPSPNHADTVMILYSKRKKHRGLFGAFGGDE